MAQFPSIKLKNSPGILPNSGSLGNFRFAQHTLKLQVLLYHNKQKHDLTPYIMHLKTSTSLGDPTGKFTMMLTFQKRWDLYIQAQDYIVIRFSRYAEKPPVIMRGFVGNVRRTRLIDDSGKVHRGITVNGENFGKIWNNYNIEYLVQEPGQSRAGNDLNPSTSKLMENMLTENYGIDFGDSQEISNKDLFQSVVDKMLNPFIEVLRTSNPQIPSLKTHIKVLDGYRIPNGGQIQMTGGSAYSFLNQFSNKPWCEIFIDDFEDAPTIIYRNAPYRNKKGILAFPESDPTSKYYEHPQISDADILEEDVGVSDNETYSYFFTYPGQYANLQADPRAMISGSMPMLESFAQESDEVNISNPHVDADNFFRFGFKDLQIASPSLSITSYQNMSYLDLAQKMNKWLNDVFNWTQFMLNGTIRMKGNERMRIGRYVTNTTTKEEYYIESVDHELIVGSSAGSKEYKFETTIGVTRGRRL